MKSLEFQKYLKKEFQNSILFLFQVNKVFYNTMSENQYLKMHNLTESQYIALFQNQKSPNNLDSLLSYGNLCHIAWYGAFICEIVSFNGRKIVSMALLTLTLFYTFGGA